MSEDQQAPTVGKGRPTPKRSEREVRRGGPVAPPPTTRREAARRTKEKQAADRAAGRTARAERPMLKRDQGPVRAYVRDLVDARRNVAIAIMPVFLLMIFALSVQDKGFAKLIQAIYLFGLVVVVVDVTSLARMVMRNVQERFPDEPTKGLRFYAIQRTTQFRRFRMPKPVVAPPPLFRRTRA